MNRKITLLAMAIFTSISCNALNYYWIGGSGNWSDLSHWSISSGGSISHSQVPQSSDNVFFDSNSFTASGQTVTVDLSVVQCADMTWTGLPTTTPAFNGGASDTLRIFGSLTLLTGMTFNIGQLSMEAITAKPITIAGTVINASLAFNGVGGIWTLQDALTVTSTINLNNGTLNTNNQTVNALTFYSSTTSVRSLIMGSSTFNISNFWYINPSGITLDATSSTINCTGISNTYQFFLGGGLTYNNIFFTGGAWGYIYDNNTIHDVSFASDGSITGNNTFHDVFFAANATISGLNTFNNVTIANNGNINNSNTFNNLTFSPFYSYTLEAGQTQTVGNICAQGTGALPIRIQSSLAGTPAIISKANGSVCWDYVHVSDIAATGGAIFNAGLSPTNSQDLGGNTGLLFTGGCTFVSCTLTPAPCIPPSIATQPSNSTICSGSNTIFAIAATGTTGLTYQWQVNPGAGFSNLINTISYNGVTTNTLSITTAGTGFNGYQYRCVVSNGICASESNGATLTVNSSPIVTVNSAAICPGQTAILTATIGSNMMDNFLTGTENYSWSNGATTNSISVSPLATTSYTVTVTSNGCSNTAIATVTVNQVPIVTASVSSSTVTVSATGGTPPYIGTGTFTGLAPGTYSYTVADANGCTANTTIIVTEPVVPAWSICANDGGTDVCCLGGYVCPPLLKVCAGTVINLSALNTFGAPYYFICPGGTYNPSNQTVVYTSSGTYNIELMDENNSNHATGTIIVEPTPIVSATPSSQTICSGVPITAIAITSNVASTTFSWVRDNTGNLMGIASSGTGSSISGILNNTTNIQQVTTFTITGTANGCTGTTTVTVYVNPRPTVGVANNSILTICSGTSTSISFGTSVLNTGLIWTVSQSGVSGAIPGYGSTISQILTTTGPTIGTATYTVTPTANGCFGNPIPVMVTVNPIPVATATPTSQTICSGNPTGIALTSPVSGSIFNWTVTQSGVTGAVAVSGSSITQTLTTTGTTAGTATYTITPTANGCSGAPITVTVTVKKIPTVTVNSATICSGQAAILTASGVGATAYTWSNGSTTNSISVSPSTTTTYTVTGTSNGTGNGCSKTAIATVSVIVCPPECNIPLDYDIASGNNLTTAFPGLTSLTNKTIRITGTFTIDHNFDFKFCRIIMTPDANMVPAKIIVAGGATLTIAGSTHQPGTHIYGCPIMWSGIEVLNGASIVVKEGSCIEDALSAVKIKQGAIGSINNSVFNRNLTGVELTSNTAAASPVTIQSTVFTSRNNVSVPVLIPNYTSGNFWNNLTTYTPANLKAPYTDIKGLYGINATNVKTLNVGVTTLASNFNGFDAIMCGINLTNTTAIIYNNKFQYLLGIIQPANCLGCPPLSPTEKGYGIKATGTTTGSYSINAGGTAANRANSFTNTYIAVFISKYRINNIIGNSITNTRTGPNSFTALNYGNVGIYVSNPANNNITSISNQTLIKNCETGIWVNRSSNTALHTISLKINDNYNPADNTLPGITADPPSSSCPNCHCTNGIYITDLLGGTATLLNSWQIKTNTITEAANGIFLQNVKKPTGGAIHNVSDNICGVRYTASGNTNGIIAKGCKGISLTLNHTKYTTGSTAYTASGNIKAYGIYLQNSSNMLVKCNTMDDAARSMVFQGACTSVLTSPPTIGITQNTMNRAQDGFVLLSSGIIGTQGSATVASNNYWVSGFSRSQTFTEIHFANNTSKLFMNSGASTFPTSNKTIFLLGTDNYLSGSGLNTSSGTTTSCAQVRTLMISNDSLSLASTTTYSDELTTLEEDSTQLPVYSDESHWMRKHFVYHELKNDPSLNNNNSLQNFYNSSNHNYSKFAKVEDKIADGQYNAANAINNSIAAGNIIENNQQTLNALILMDLISPGYLYTSSDTAILTTIANQCPLAGGYAVYQARNLLMTFADNVIEFADNCTEEAERLMNSINTGTDEASNSFKLYPNPNDGNMALEYSIGSTDVSIIRLYDVAGKIVDTYELNAATNKLLISNTKLNDGIYFYQIVVNNKIVKRDKLIITK